MYSAVYACSQRLMHEIVNFQVGFYTFCILWQNRIYIFGGFHIGIAARAGNAFDGTVKMCDAEGIKNIHTIKCLRTFLLFITR